MKKYLFLLFLLFVRIDIVYADVSANISVSSNNTIIGNSGKATLTISGNGEHIGQVYGTFSCEGLGNLDLTYVLADVNAPTSRTYTIDWTAKSSGVYTCSISSVQVGLLEHPDKGLVSVNASSKVINVVGSNNSKSSNNSGTSSQRGNPETTKEKKEYDADNLLKSLSIDQYKIQPNFDKDTLEYRLEVDESVEKINVSAVASSDKASVNGTGEVHLTQGENTIEVKVTAENGNERIYKIIVVVTDLHPIHVKVMDKEYTVVKKNNQILDKLEFYDEEVIKIDDQEVISYINKKTKTRLVMLKDSNNKVRYYVYNETNHEYQLYRYITVGNITLQLLDAPHSLEHFQKYEVIIKDEKIDFYKIKSSHQVGLIYGTNVKSGSTGYYVYNIADETLSKYYDDEVKYVSNQYLDFRNKTMIFMGIVSGITIICIIISISSVHKSRNRAMR